MIVPLCAGDPPPAERVQRQVSASGNKVQGSGTMTVSRGIITKRGPLADEVGTLYEMQNLITPYNVFSLECVVSRLLSQLSAGDRMTCLWI